MKSLMKHHLTWMSLNDRTKKNRLEQWCAFKSIVQHGIINCLQPACLNNQFRICSYLWTRTRKVWRMLMWKRWCSSSLSNLGSWWWPLSLAVRPNQPPFHGASNQILSSHHLSHYRVFAIVIYPLKVVY